jgi:pimeloyl-ACP methyl ester carboxylesterase
VFLVISYIHSEPALAVTNKPAVDATGKPAHCMMEQVQAHLQTSLARQKTENLRDNVPADFFDQKLAAAYKAGKLDLSEAPGEFFRIKTGGHAGKFMHFVDLGPETSVPFKGNAILLGGLRYHARQWNESGTVDTLRQNGYRVIVIDPPGQGWTYLRELFENGSSPGFLRVPPRYEKEDQASAIHDLLMHLKEKDNLNKETTFLAGESYGGWLTSYLGTLPEFEPLLNGIIPLDHGVANTTHVLSGADQWNTMREQVERFSPEAAKLIPAEFPGSKSYKKTKDTKDKTVLEMIRSPLVTVQLAGRFLQSFRDGLYKIAMDAAYPKKYREQSPVRYSSAPSLFNGIREYDAAENAGKTLIPTYQIEAADNHGIVPHLQHKKYAENNPQLKGWYRLLNTGHDMPVEAGHELALLMMAAFEGRVQRVPPKFRVDFDPKKDLQHIIVKKKPSER